MAGVLLAAGILLVAETLNILAEMWAAGLPSTSSLFELKNLYLFVMVLVGCSLLLVGYSVAYHTTKNIWVATVGSIGGILIMEPFLAYTLFHQLPERGSLVGFVLGAIGLIVTVTWR